MKQRSDDNLVPVERAGGGNDVDDPSPFDERPMGVANGVEVARSLVEPGGVVVTPPARPVEDHGDPGGHLVGVRQHPERRQLTSEADQLGAGTSIEAAMVAGSTPSG